MKLTPFERFKENIIEIIQVLEISKKKYFNELKSGKPDPNDFTIHLLLDACILFSVAAFEYYMKERLKPRNIENLMKHYKLQSIDSVIDLLNKELNIKFSELNLSQHEIISIKVFFAWRHMIIHNRGRADIQFIQRVEPMYRRLRLNFNILRGDRFLLEPIPVENFIENLEKFVFNFDQIIAEKYP